MSMDSLYYAWFYCGGRMGEVGIDFDVNIEVFGDVVNFSTSINLKETLAKFFKIFRHSVFRVPIFLAYVEKRARNALEIFRHSVWGCCKVRLVRFRREKRARNDSTSSRPNIAKSVQ